jgi:uncharacterized membrane protein SirB2
MLVESPLLQKKWVKVLPHIIDSLLLVSAIVLAIQIAQYPIVNGWLTAKVIALLVYIILGSIALKRGKTKRVRVIAGIFAMIVVFYLVSVAVTKSVFGFLMFL